MELKRIHDYLWEIPRTGGMRVPGRVYADAAILGAVREEGGLQQVANVAHLPGIVGYSLAMPDIHWGYGFPIGGVAATDPEQGGVISPGGVGYDINCGVRMCSTRLMKEQVQPRIESVVAALFNRVPCGVGSHGGIGRVSRKELDAVVTKGAAWAVERGFGTKAQLDTIEDGGMIPGADPMMVSDRAKERGLEQIGTLGSGNHFIELDVVEEIYHPEAAAECGLIPGGIALLIHTGSRGFGYQVCDDYLKVMSRAVRQYGIDLPDRQLACAPVHSSEGKAYLAAMACAANFAWANRQAIMGLAEQAIMESLRVGPREAGLRLVYDVSHNIAKLEEHLVGGRPKKLCVHRKGATRAHIPRGTASPWRHGQPVIVPGDMGSESYLCVGTDASMDTTWGSSCHGAGRVLSRAAARKKFAGRDLIGELKEEGITVMAEGRGTVAEEMRGAYKNVSQVVGIMERAGVSLRVARLRPIGVVKG
jgi:tRNA-splicing ligase RtcB (3'-phosphate/5'-hydroxy nucleic acid ligase)